jgi:catechol 2,3-dioxygenase-like lactoylglutathione lyase family enzyme
MTSSINALINKVRFFTLRTKDLAAARNFYVDPLGLHLIIEEQVGEFFQISIAGVPVCVDLSGADEPFQPNQIGIEVADLPESLKPLRPRDWFQ